MLMRIVILSDAGLAELKDLKNLQTLDLSYNAKITDAGMKELKSLASLQTLDLGWTDVTDAGLKDPMDLKGLKTLVLYKQKPDPRYWMPGMGDPPAGHWITGAGVKDRAELKGLQTLDISGNLGRRSPRNSPARCDSLQTNGGQSHPSGTVGAGTSRNGCTTA